MPVREYSLVVEGELSQELCTVFAGMTLAPKDGNTLLVGQIRDQAELQGLPIDRVVNTVSQEGFPVSVSRRPSRATPGDLISQSPAARQSASKNTTVELVVSTGELAERVPDVSGQRVYAATSSIQGAGFIVALIGQANAAVPGTVFQTEPPAGAVAALGSDVQVMVSKGPATTDVPDVVSKRAGDAVETRSGAGFVVADTTVFSDEPKGQVVSQSPAGGQSEAKGATTSINISKGPER
jgi:beta-lactam-binding protein with PASTA domain